MTEVQRLVKIKLLNELLQEYELRAKYNTDSRDYDLYSALDWAIKALEQEPNEPVGNSDKLDCISREALLASLNERGIPYHAGINEAIMDLPSVQPKDVLDKIITEIEHLTITEGGEDYIRKMAELYSLKIKVLQIIDKYRLESESSSEKPNK